MAVVLVSGFLVDGLIGVHPEYRNQGAATCTARPPDGGLFQPTLAACRESIPIEKPYPVCP